LRWPRELIRYGLIGVVLNAAGFLIYVLFTTIIGVNPIAYISAFYPVRIVLAFYLNKKWSFTHEGHVPASAIRYLIAYISCYLLNVAMLKYLYEYWGISHVLVQAIAIVVIGPLLFVILKFWVFKENSTIIQCAQAK